ncbi:transposase [Streptomyces sp. NPDC002778]
MTHRQLCLRPLALLVCAAAGQAGGGRILAVASTPSLAAKLPMWKLAAMLRRAGRRRGIETDAERVQQLFRQEAPRQLPLVEDAMGKQARALVQLDAACEAVDDRARATEEAFRTRPDAVITLSLPGIGARVGARILGEIGDDRSRFASAAGLKAYAVSAPITRASGERRYVGRRFVRNNRLNHVGRLWLSTPSAVHPVRTPTTGAAGQEGLAYAGSAAPVQPDARRMSRFPAQVSRRSHAQAGSYAAVGSWGMRFRPVSSSR